MASPERYVYPEAAEKGHHTALELKWSSLQLSPMLLAPITGYDSSANFPSFAFTTCILNRPTDCHRPLLPFAPPLDVSRRRTDYNNDYFLSYALLPYKDNIDQQPERVHEKRHETIPGALAE
jgi:hypothetical protein